MAKTPSLPLPQDGAGQGTPLLTQHYSKGTSSLLGKVLLETKRVSISQYRPGVQPESGVPTHVPPQPHGMGPPSASRVLEAGKQVVAPETWPCCRNLAVLPALSWATGDGGCGLRHTSLRPCACLVRSDQEEDQSALRSLSRFN